MDTPTKLEAVVPSQVATAAVASSSARPSATERAAERLARLQAAVKAAKHQERDALDRQAAIVGHALIAAMRSDAKLRGTVVDVLRRKVTKPADRAEIAVLLLIEAAP